MAAGFTQTGNRDAVDAAIWSSIFGVGEKRRCTRAGKTTVEGREDVNQHVDTDIFVTLLLKTQKMIILICRLFSAVIV